MCLKSSAPFFVMPRLTERLWGFEVSFPRCACVFPNSVRGAQRSRGRSAAHDHTDALSGKCPQGITGVSFYLAPSINSLYLHLRGWIRENLSVSKPFLYYLKKKEESMKIKFMSVGKYLSKTSFHPFTGLFALLCGLGALCWHGAGHNSGENVYSQRGKGENVFFWMFSLYDCYL